METFLLLKKELRCPIKITKSGCWLFTGGSKNGFHGSLYYKGVHWQAHRLAFILVNGSIPDNLNVLHSCDVGMCINPSHLFLGTQQDNIADMINKGRSNFSQPGSNNGRATIDVDDVLFIRLLYSLGIKRRQICDEYNLAFSHITRIINGKAWSHI